MSKSNIISCSIPQFSSKLERNRWIIEKCNGYSYQAIARVVGCTRQRVEQIVNRDRYIYSGEEVPGNLNFRWRRNRNAVQKQDA